MKKTFIITLLLAAAVTSAIFFSCKGGDESTEIAGMSYEDSVKASLAHGEYLTVYVSQCLDCHSKRDITKFSMPVIPGTEGEGGIVFGAAEGVPGEVTPPNITPFALKDWTDDEIARAITQGINKKGDTLFPLMPYHGFSRMSRYDVYSIITYIRSLKPIEKTTAPKKLMITPAMYGPLPKNSLSENVRPDPSDKVKYGQYLVTAAACSECHTPRTPQGAPDFSRAFSGGFTFDYPFMKVTVANITPDSATGIGAWSEDVFVAKFKNNASDSVVNRNPGPQNTIMPWANYGKMKESDIRAIYAYLRTVPPVTNKVEKWPALAK